MKNIDGYKKDRAYEQRKPMNSELYIQHKAKKA